MRYAHNDNYLERMLSRAGLALGCAFALLGCWGGDDTPASTPQSQTPVSPMPQPGLPTPTSPLPQPNLPESASFTPQGGTDVPKVERKAISLAEMVGKANPLALSNMNQVHPGMALEQVNRVLGKDGIVVSSASVDSEIYRWSDDTGASFVAKFEDGKLVRKSSILPGDAADSASDDEDDSVEGLLTLSAYDKVLPGMTIEEIQSLLGVDRRSVSGNNTSVAMYEWVDRKGSNFFARFEDGRMTRKTGFHVAPMNSEKDAAETPPEEGSDNAGEAVPFPDESPESSPSPSVDAEMLAVNSTRLEPVSPVEVLEETPPAKASAKPKVAIIGGDREGGSSYQPDAKFPDYTWQFHRGNYEVRIKNTADMGVKVGLREGKYGKDIEIKPGRSASVNVNQGSYTIYFQYEDDPQNVYTGNSFTIDGMQVADVEVQVFNEAYDIGVLNRSGN